MTDRGSAPARWVGFAALAALLLMAEPARAQVGFGPQLSYAGGDGIDPGFGIGARVQFPILGDFQSEEQTTMAGALRAVISLDRFFPDCGPVSCSLWEVNANGAVPVLAIDAYLPYIGAGVRVARFSSDAGVDIEDDSDNDFGINLLAGVHHDISGLFAELRAGLAGDNNPLALTVGVLLGG